MQRMTAVADFHPALRCAAHTQSKMKMLRQHFASRISLPHESTNSIMLKGLLPLDTRNFSHKYCPRDNVDDTPKHKRSMSFTPFL